MKELLIAMYRIRPCHKMIPLSVKIRTRAVSSCGPGAALSTLVTTFSLQPSGLTSNQRVLYKRRTVYEQSVWSIRSLRWTVRSNQILIRHELAAEELRLAAQSLGHLTGHLDVGELFDVIFEDFCCEK